MIYRNSGRVSGQPPLNFKNYSGSIQDYLIEGNTSQNGTPTPSDPVDVVGCGERTRNLFDYQTMAGTIKGYYLDSNGNLQETAITAVTDYIPCSGGEFSLAKVGGISPSICLYDNNKNFLYGQSYNTLSGSDKRTIVVNSPVNASYIRFSYFFEQAPKDDLSAIMLNTGSTAKPYEPYGYKLPPTVNGQEIPIYLGQVPTTRRIKKLVLTGEENWSEDSAGDSKFFIISIAGATGGGSIGGIMCSHFVNVEIFTSNTAIGIWLTGRRVFRVRPSGVSSISKDDFTAWLASEYSAGHPVTVWYVLAEPETAIINEPLHKIGDYADTISKSQSNLPIPTISGQNTLTIPTTISPSNVSLTLDQKEIEKIYEGGKKEVELSGVPPISFNAIGSQLEDYLIEGNTSQNGTPTPEAPIGVIGCGIFDETQQSYKLLLAVNGTEYPIYLGQVPTTRRIKKLVLTGDEDWDTSYNGANNNYFRINQFTTALIEKVFCTHYVSPDKNISVNNTIEGCKIQTSSQFSTILIIRPPQWKTWTTNDFKSYLATQYQNGTPVTVWYILAEPETGIVNEPLMKIGDYADTISKSQSNLPIPITTGSNTLSIETTIQPSNITINYNKQIKIAEVYGGIGENYPIYYMNRTIEGTSPIMFKGLGKDLKDYTILGNTSQNGTPTPESPVDVQGCEERTTQLIPKIVQGGVSTADGFLSNSSNRVRTNYIPVESGKTYAVSSGNLYLSTGCYYNNGVFIRKIDEVVAATTSATFTVPENVNQIAIGFKAADDTANITPSDLQNYMLNEGSTPLTYEPYGYKLPLTVNGTEYPIYLGQVPTTRRIKKVVFDGTEQGWGKNTGLTNSNAFVIAMSNWVGNRKIGYCTHYQNVTDAQAAEGIFFGNSLNILTAFADGLDDTTKFKKWLAAQYAAGTPVTVWYVLATPETGIVNEPLMKIGDYADTISMAQAGVTIPTVAGANTLTIGTTVQPSEVSITGNIKEVST